MDDATPETSWRASAGKRLRFMFQRPAVLSALLFVAMLSVYGYSVPGSFNTVEENRRFFDSDGEFITRQFRQGRTFTHNDHLLYHILGKWLFTHAENIPGIRKDPVSSHKA